MKRLLLIAKVALASLCISSVAFGANIKVVCKSDPKHDRAKLIQAMKTARSGDKIVIIGTCLPRGIQAQARDAYRPNLIKVEIFEATRPQQYDSWKFDREIIYSPLFDTSLPRAVIIDNSRRNVRSTTTTTTTKTTEMKEGAKSTDKEHAKDQQQVRDEAVTEEDVSTQEEAVPEQNSDIQEGAAPEDNTDTQEEATSDDSSDSQSEAFESDGGSDEDSGSDGGDDGGSDSSGEDD